MTEIIQCCSSHPSRPSLFLSVCGAGFQLQICLFYSVPRCSHVSCVSFSVLFFLSALDLCVLVLFIVVSPGPLQGSLFSVYLFLSRMFVHLFLSHHLCVSVCLLPAGYDLCLLPVLSSISCRFSFHIFLLLYLLIDFCSVPRCARFYSTSVCLSASVEALSIKVLCCRWGKVSDRGGESLEWVCICLFRPLRLFLALSLLSKSPNFCRLFAFHQSLSSCVASGNVCLWF